MNPVTQSSPLAPLVLVTGATRGLGLAISRHLLEAGYRVVASARKATPELEALQARFGQALNFMPFDLSDTTRIHGFVRELTRNHGQQRGGGA
jgi:3-oxoacyl-[acyl-carrier protein] reductase